MIICFSNFWDGLQWFLEPWCDSWHHHRFCLLCFAVEHPQILIQIGRDHFPRFWMLLLQQFYTHMFPPVTYQMDCLQPHKYIIYRNDFPDQNMAHQKDYHCWGLTNIWPYTLTCVCMALHSYMCLCVVKLSSSFRTIWDLFFEASRSDLARQDQWIKKSWIWRMRSLRRLHQSGGGVSRSAPTNHYYKIYDIAAKIQDLVTVVGDLITFQLFFKCPKGSIHTCSQGITGTVLGICNELFHSGPFDLHRVNWFQRLFDTCFEIFCCNYLESKKNMHTSKTKLMRSHSKGSAAFITDPKSWSRCLRWQPPKNNIKSITFPALRFASWSDVVSRNPIIISYHSRPPIKKIKDTQSPIFDCISGKILNYDWVSGNPMKSSTKIQRWYHDLSWWVGAGQIQVGNYDGFSGKPMIIMVWFLAPAKSKLGIVTGFLENPW